MFSKFKTGRLSKLYLEPDLKKIVGNSFSLLILQGTNFLLPLILLPFLVQTLGFEKFGLISFAQSLISFWIIFTDYGFQISATREVSLYREDANKLSQIVNNTLKTKLFLSAISFVIYLLVISLIPPLSKHFIFYLLTFIMVIGQSFVPVWFFQGVEKMHVLTYINFISKALFAIFIIILVKGENDYVYVTLFYGLGTLIGGSTGIYLMYKKFDLKFSLLQKWSLGTELKKGWHYFISYFSTNIYLNANTLFLGFYANEAVVGFYAIAEKVVYVVKLFISIFLQATFPKACQYKEKGWEALMAFYKRYFFPFSLFILIITAMLFIWSDAVVWLLVKRSVPEITFAIRSLCIVPIVVCFNIPASQTLMAYDLKKDYMVVLVIGSCINILLNLVLPRWLYMAGTILSIITTELFIAIALYAVLIMKHNLLKRINFNLDFQITTKSK